MRKVLLFIFLMAGFLLHAQSVKVKKETVRVKGENAEGFEVKLEGNADDVESQLTKYLKPIGKSKKTDNVASISLPSVNGKTYTSPLYATVKGDGTAWIGIKDSEWPAESGEIKKDIEKMVYEFGVTFYREKVQRQIDESNQALQAVEKQQLRYQNQNKDLNTKLENNRLEKIRLEKALENNKLELETLTKKLEQNIKDQDSVKVVNEQIKKLIEIQKDKQRKIN
jgi:hypothetical protein